jgi:hypothetical protein
VMSSVVSRCTTSSRAPSSSTATSAASPPVCA